MSRVLKSCLRILAISSIVSISLKAKGQDPVPALPLVDIGLINMSDGLGGSPGLYYVSYLQIYQTDHFNDQNGKPINTGLKVNSLATIHVASYLSKLRFFGGDWGCLVAVPVIKISSSISSGPAPSVNPSMLGDVDFGTSIQWSNKKLFKKDLSHRIEVDVIFPTGPYSSKYAINVSAHLYTFSLFHAFTYSLSNHLAISSRNTFNYNTAIEGTVDKPGAFYNGNYALEYALSKALRFELAAYYLAQFNQDTHAGSAQYYLDNFGISNTKERVLGYGPGLSYITTGGVFLEGKVFFEDLAQNRPEGIVPTVRIIIPIVN